MKKTNYFERTVEYCDRAMYVYYNWKPYEEATNFGPEVELISAIYRGRNVKRLINIEKVEEKIMEMEIEDMFIY